MSDLLSREAFASPRGKTRLRVLCVVAAAVCAAVAYAIATLNHMGPHREWAAIAVFGYAACAVLLLFRRATTVALVALVGLSVVAPLAILIDRHVEQHEVTIVSAGAARLLETGSPYITAPTDLNQVFPYFPLMSVFGLPGAVFGRGVLLTDTRIYFTLFFVVVLWSAARRITSARTATVVVALVSAFPMVALPIGTGGVDLPIVALAAFAVVSLWTGEYRFNALAVGVGCAIKFTFWPLAAMMLVLQFRRGRRPGQILEWSGIVLAIGVATVLPSALVDPQGFLRSAIEFPLGRSSIESPAGAGLIGGPLSHLGAVGTAVIGLILLATGVAITWRLLRAPRLTVADMLLLAAAGYTVLFLVSPVSRPGYFVVPFVLVVLTVTSFYSDADSPSRGAPLSPGVRH